MKQYWGYRICTDFIPYFSEELEAGRLRQGWDYDPRQNLKSDMVIIDGELKANKRMFTQVKKGDYLLVPRIPDWNSVAIVEATEDWDIGYRFDNANAYGDFGHIFPAKKICSFNRNSKVVSGNIRSTLRNPGRFWNVTYLADEIEKIVQNCDNEEILTISQRKEDRFFETIEGCYKDAFRREEFASNILTRLQTQFRAAEWEDALVFALKELFPEPLFEIERTGGRSEAYHGTDVKITFNNPLTQLGYVMAIQVKDYESCVENIDQFITQINKSEKYWREQTGCQLVEKILIVIRTNKSCNERLVRACEEQRVILIMEDELKRLLTQVGFKLIARKFPFEQ